MNKTEELTKAFFDCTAHITSIKRTLNTAECDLANATIALGDYLTPKYAVVGEIFNIWLNGECAGIKGDIMLSVKKEDSHRYTITKRDIRTDNG